MKKFEWYRTIITATVVAFAVVGFSSPAGAAAETEHIRGTVTDVNDSGFTVKTDNGSRKVELSPGTRIAGVVKSSLNKVKPGTFIGTANVPHQGKARALEVVVFPDSMKGTGLGDYPWDLPVRRASSSSMTNGTVGSSNSSAMTNGTVSSSGSQAMTNGTVKSASGSSHKTVTVDYGKGKKTITIPSDVPVVMLQKGNKSDIAKGAHVFVAGPKGSNPFKAKVVAVGLNGTVPPM